MSYWCQKAESNTGKRVLELITAMKYLSWEAIESRLDNFPEEASETDKFGVTSLHHAIRKRHTSAPFHIVRSLIEAFPQGLKLSDDMTGVNALHLACINCDVEGDKGRESAEIVKIIIHEHPDSARHLCKEGRVPLHRAKNFCIAKMLIDTYPESLKVLSKNDYLPLHDACSDNSVPPDVVNLLIEEGRANKVGMECRKDRYCGGVLMKDIHGDIPLKILFRRIMFSSSSTSKGRAFKKNDDLLWIKLCIVVKATYVALRNFPDGFESKKIPLLHAIIACGGDPKIVEQALRFNPDEIMQRDDDGRCPLAVAASKVDTRPEVFDLLVRANKGTARMLDLEGRLSLHLAVESGRTLTNGIESIIRAAPLALHTRDESRMYPFMLAAIPNYRWDNTSIDDIFTLLRDAPEVMHTFCRNK